MPVEEVCGIGMSRTKWLHERGAYNLDQARKIESPAEISELVWLQRDDPLVAIADLEPAKSVSRTFTTFKAVDDLTQILRLVRNLTEEATSKLREMEMAGRTLALSLSGELGFWTRLTLKSPLTTLKRCTTC